MASWSNRGDLATQAETNAYHAIGAVGSTTVVPGATLYDSTTGRRWQGITVAGLNYWAPMPGALVALLRQNAAQNIATGQFIDMLMHVEELDVLNGHTGTSALYVPTVPGWYEVGGGVCFSVHATGYRSAQVLKNTVPMSAIFQPPATTALIVPLRPTPLYLNGTTDAVKINVYQSSGTTLNTLAAAYEYAPSMSVVYLGP